MNGLTIMGRPNLRFIFWGTPEFASISLKALVDAGYTPYAVVTAIDKVSGRGRRLKASPVKELALTQNIPVWQPASLKDPLFVQKIRESNPDFMLVVAFRMLPQEIIEISSMGTWNLHASLLPDLRGAAPIHWAVRLGYRVTGLTVFKIQYQIDTGDILDSIKLDIPMDWNAGKLHDVMAHEGAKLLVNVVPRILEGNYLLRPQNECTSIPESLSNKAPKIQRSDALIDWGKDSLNLENFIRAFAPAPGADTSLNGPRLVLLDAMAEEPSWGSGFSRENMVGISLGSPTVQTFVQGSCVVIGSSWWIRTQNSWLRIKQIKPENSKVMTVDAFLRGHGDINGQICSGEL